MELSLTKLPWYGQIGAFVVVCAGAVFGFWKFYVSEVQTDIAMRQTHLTALRADIDKGVATARRLPEFQSQVTELEAKLENLRNVLPEQKDVADTLRRIQGLATQSNLTILALHAGAAEAAAALRGGAVSDFRRGHLPQPRTVLRSRQQVPADHQRRRDRDPRQRAAATESDASPPSAPRRRSCCRKRPREGGAYRRLDDASSLLRRRRECCQRTRGGGAGRSAAARPGRAGAAPAGRHRGGQERCRAGRRGASEERRGARQALGSGADARGTATAAAGPLDSAAAGSGRTAGRTAAAAGVLARTPTTRMVVAIRS